MTDTISREDLLKLLRDHHRWHVESGKMGIPDGEGGWLEIDNAAQYADSRLSERTAIALEELPVEIQPTPRLGSGSNHWENWQLAMRRLKIANKALQAISELPVGSADYAARIQEIANDTLDKTVTKNPYAKS